jgi:hypothetical protein
MDERFDHFDDNVKAAELFTLDFVVAYDMFRFGMISDEFMERYLRGRDRRDASIKQSIYNHLRSMEQGVFCPRDRSLTKSEIELLKKMLMRPRGRK